MLQADKMSDYCQKCVIKFSIHGSPITIQRIDLLYECNIFNIFQFVTTSYVHSYFYFFTETHLNKAGKLSVLRTFSILYIVLPT